MSHDEEQLRMASDGLEPVSPTSRRPGGTGLRDTKKVAVLIALVVIGLGVAAFQFLRGNNPQPATAAPAASAASAGVVPAPGPSGEASASAEAGSMPGAATGPKDVESVLSQLDSGAESSDDLSVARVERLVQEFDGYVRNRQVPLDRLQVNPFALPPAPEEKPRIQEGNEASKSDAAETARRQRIRDAAARLVLGSVMMAGQRGLAIINGKLCGVGDVVAGFRVDAIQTDHVRVSADGEKVDLSLRPKAESAERGGSDGR